MTVRESPATVLIQPGRFRYLYADDYGLTLRDSRLSAERRFAWAEVGRFADGSCYRDGYLWVLSIVLRTGETVQAICTVNRATPEFLNSVRLVADHYGVPADLTGTPAKEDGRPAETGLYEDPGGQGGLRFWDGSQWSPLLPPHIGQHETVRKSQGSWSELPVADTGWTYAARRARSSAVKSAFFALGSAGLLAWGMLSQFGLSSPRHMGVGPWFGIGGFAVLYAVAAFGFGWRHRRFFLKLDKAAKPTPGTWS